MCTYYIININLRINSKYQNNILLNRRLFLRENPYMPTVYSSFVKQLMDDVCSPMRPNLSVLNTKYDGIKDYIKLGFK